MHSKGTHLKEENEPPWQMPVKMWAAISYEKRKRTAPRDPNPNRNPKLIKSCNTHALRRGATGRMADGG